MPRTPSNPRLLTRSIAPSTDIQDPTTEAIVQIEVRSAIIHTTVSIDLTSSMASPLMDTAARTLRQTNHIESNLPKDVIDLIQLGATREDAKSMAPYHSNNTTTTGTRAGTGAGTEAEVETADIATDMTVETKTDISVAVDVTVEMKTCIIATPVAITEITTDTSVTRAQHLSQANEATAHTHQNETYGC